MTRLEFLILLGYGSIAGIAAGMLGIGGGMLLVPLLSMHFAARSFPTDHLVHMAVATSLATIVFTAVSSVAAHHRRGAVLWPVAASLAPGMFAGSLAGAQIAATIPTATLAAGFAGFVVFSATQMLLDRQPKPSRVLPGAAVLLAVGAAIGLVSSFVGAGGGFLSVPFMTWCNVRVHQAVATSAALGLPIALAGSLGFIIAGWDETDLPAGSLGYVHLPSLAAVVAASVLTAPLGARIAHALPVRALKRVFAVFLYLLAFYMLSKALQWR